MPHRIAQQTAHEKTSTLSSRILYRRRCNQHSAPNTQAATLQLNSLNTATSITQHRNVNHFSLQCINTLPHCKNLSFPCLKISAKCNTFSLPPMKTSDDRSHITHLHRTQYLSSTPSAASSGPSAIRVVVRVKGEFRDR